MEDQGQQDPKSPSIGSERSEPVRSRWIPKPEQILILESIFNSGMVNPPKDETVKIRELLEKFGAVGDANVFYWFQNRRSRSRRRQRQMQASLEQNNQLQTQVGGANPYQHHQTSSSSSAAAMAYGASSSSFGGYSPSYLSGSSSSCSVPAGGQEGFGGFFSSASPQMVFHQIVDHNSSPAPSVLYPSSDAPNLNYSSGFGGTGGIPGSITVFINGVTTEVPRGPMDFKTMFGENLMLVHSSGVSVPTNEFGFSMQSLQHGESYFLVSKQTQV